MKRGFTLVELLVVNVVAVTLIGVFQPAAGGARAPARNGASMMNMRTLGAAGMGFASDNAGEIFSFNPNLNIGQIEAIQILSQTTGRPIDDSIEGLRRLTSVMPHRRYQHLMLFEYLSGQMPEPIAASPFDRNLLEWQVDPVLAQSTTVPYATNSVPAGYDRSSNWFNDDVRQMWPYASTYQVVPAAWNPNNNDGAVKSWTPITTTPHLFSGGTGQQRFFQEVVFPSHKVHMFEEFDRMTKGSEGLWFAYPEAKCNLLFFDGSVRRQPSHAANPGWNPSQRNSFWQQTYVPLHTFPSRAPGYKHRTQLTMKYRWTREGLAGLDFGGKEINVPDSVLNHPDYPGH